MNQKTSKTNETEERIFELSSLVAGDFSLQEILDKLAEAAVKSVGVRACSIRLLNDQTGDVDMRSRFGLSETYQNKGTITKDDPVVKQVFTGQPVIVDDMRVDDRVSYRQAAIKEGLVSQLTVPLIYKNKPVGVFRLYSDKPKRFSQSDIKLAQAVASQCAVAITNAKFYAESLQNAHMVEQVRLAGIIQRRMIPQQPPEIEELDIASTYIPCFEVGGDLYDFIRVDDRHLIVAIADVIGKGVPAAIMISSFQATIRAYVQTLDCHDLLCIVKKLNEMACREYKDGEFITLFLALIDLEEMSIQYCNCGHEPTILFRKDKAIDLDKGGLVLGVDKDADYESDKIKLLRSDILIFYTDGLIDAVNFDYELWGRRRLIKAAEKFRKDNAEQMERNILGYRRRFVGLAKQTDDTSVIIIKVNSDGMK